MTRIEDVRDSRKVTSSDEVWRGRIVGVLTEQVDLGDGVPIVREWIDHPGAVAIVALDERDRVLMIYQYRHPVRARLWEIPAGLLDVAGEDYLVAAGRELAEETDLRARRWDLLVDIFCTPGGSNESLRVYLARDLVPAGTAFMRRDEEAEMELAWVPVDEAVSAVMEGRIHSPSATVGILALAQARAVGYERLRPVDAHWFR